MLWTIFIQFYILLWPIQIYDSNAKGEYSHKKIKAKCITTQGTDGKGINVNSTNDHHSSSLIDKTLE